MNWYKNVKHDKTAKIGLTQSQLNDKLKSIIRNSSFFQKLFIEYGVKMDAMDDSLLFVAKDLDGKYAQGNGKYIFINSKLFEDGKFFQDRIHYCVHEIVHWLTRQKEKHFYLADSEEVASFTAGIEYEILRGRSKEQIEEIFRPILDDHFEKDGNAEKMFEALFLKAIERAKDFSQE